MSNPSDITIHHRDVYGYFIALEKFFQDTEVKHDRSNSPRAQKARAKLLKLSPSQFYELSTDVYDELQRRTNDNQDKPDYLLPKASFHIKRNQARQKLANLSQTRFNDLVDDILYEIKRRGYDVNPDATNYSHSDEEHAFDRGSEANFRNQHNENSVNSMSDNSLVHVPPTATIQTSQVIPMKASIDWSSEDEEELELSKTASNSIAIGSIISPQDYAQPAASPESAAGISPTDNYHYTDLNESPAGTREIRNDSSSDINHNGIPTLAKNVEQRISDKDTKELQKELENLKKANDTLQSQLDGKDRELDELRKQKTLSKHRESHTNFQKELTSLSSQVSTLSIENETLKQQISELELKAKTVGPAKLSDDKHNLLDDLQTRYPLDARSLSKYSTADGLVTLETIKKLHSQINVMFVNIQSEKEDVGKELFEALACASNCIHRMLILVDIPQYKDEVTLLKASLSHAVTAVRYYSVYRSMLPRVTVQAAISEVAFAICNLVNSTKIKLEDVKGKPGATNEIKEAKRDSAVAPQTPIEPQFGSRLSQDLLQRPSDVFTVTEDNKDEMSPVKPLKLTQRANMSPNPNLKPTSARKTSGSLFFTSMIDTKSPKSSLSSAHSGKILFKSPNEKSDKAVEEDGKPLLKVEDKERAQKPSDKRMQLKLEVPPTTPTKSVNNKTVEVIDGTPSLPTPAAVAPTSDKKPITSSDKPFVEKLHLSPSHKEPIKKSTKNGSPEHGAQAVESTMQNETSPSRSFADKLKSFANGTGIGLRAETEPSVQSSATKDASPEEGASPERKSNDSKEDTQEAADRDLSKTTPAKNDPSKITSPMVSKYEEAKSTVDRSLQKVKNSLKRAPEVNPTPSKLTERFKKAFEDMSDNDSEEESKSDLNDSSNLSDDGSTYLALKQSMRRNDQHPNDHRTIQKATVYSPRAQQNSQFNDSETKFGTDTDLSDAPSEHSFVKEKATIVEKPPQNINLEKHGSIEAGAMMKTNNQALDPTDADELSLNAAPFAEELDSKKVKKEDLDESSDYQFVPLRKERSQNGANANSNLGSHENETVPEENEDDRRVDFDFDAFDIENPDNTLSELLLYLEHQTVQVISTIQSLLTSIKQPQVTKGNLRTESNAINQVTRQMVDATSISMNQSRNASLKEHGTWVVRSLEDCSLRMITLCQLNREGKVSSIKGDDDFADKHFKQRLAGIAFDVAKCTKELVKTVEEASLKEEIAFLNSRLN